MAVQPPLFSENLRYPSQDPMPPTPPFFPFPDPFPNPFPVESSLLANGRIYPPPFPHSVNLSDELEFQRRELDLFLHLENEKLKLAIQDQKNQQLSALIRSMEARATARMRETEQDLAEARRKRAELEQRLETAEEETEKWRRTARENEGTMLGLIEMLGQAQDAESVIAGGEDDKTGRLLLLLRCKGCGEQRSRVVLMPCRHLCACGVCGGVLEKCPVCGSVKEGYIEVFL